MNSPYEGVPVERWKEITKTLIEKHPLQLNELSSVVLAVWEDIFKSEIGSKPFRIGVDLFPRPQIMAFFLHELIPLELAQRHPGEWKREDTPDEKDIVCVRDPLYWIEIKTSSHATRIFGNRSYAQETLKAKKSKSGFYLTINFEGFRTDRRGNNPVFSHHPRITLLRFGWLDQTDWVGQKSASGQQARLTSEADQNKLVRIELGESDQPRLMP